MFCRERVARLGEHIGAIADRGASLHAVGNGTAPMVQDFIEQFSPPFPVWTDPSKQTYRLAGFRHSFGLGLRSLALGRRAMSGGFRQGRTQGDPFQQGGTLVLGQNGAIWYSQAAKAAGEHAPIDEILAALDAAEPAA